MLGGTLKRLGILAFLLILIFTPSTLVAQTNKGVIEVSVTDESAAAIPGVTVTLRRPDTGFAIVEVTATNGVAHFVALDPGTYTMCGELEGFAPVSRDGVVLRVGQTNRLAATLRPQASEAITVEAFVQVVDVYRADTSSNIVPEQIDALPVADRDFQKLAFIAPGVQRERGGFRFIGGGPIIGSAGNASQPTIMVDGVDYTDQALGLARTRFSQDAIRERALLTPEREALAIADGSLRLTYAELDERAVRVAIAIARDLGVAKGDRIGP